MQGDRGLAAGVSPAPGRLALPGPGAALYIHGPADPEDPGHPGRAAGPFAIPGPRGWITRIRADDPRASAWLSRADARFRLYEADRRTTAEMRETRAAAEARLHEHERAIAAPRAAAQAIDRCIAGVFTRLLCSMTRIVISVRAPGGRLYITCRDREKTPGKPAAVSLIDAAGTVATPPGETVSSSWSMARAFHQAHPARILLHCHLIAARNLQSEDLGWALIGGTPRTPEFGQRLAGALSRRPVAVRPGDGVWCAGDTPHAMIKRLAALQTACLQD